MEHEAQPMTSGRASVPLRKAANLPSKDVSNTKTVCRSVRDVHATRHRPIVKRRWTPAPHHQAGHFSNSDKNRYQ
jgi:hypothetical protein